MKRYALVYRSENDAILTMILTAPTMQKALEKAVESLKDDESYLFHSITYLETIP